ncbi:MAG: recombination protein O N-terminal domain-containing protein [Anaplasmataceae bacterium]|nr:recombination protein O N-terminal domain-containing protein [Anaplasmataceae bacterium]
MRELVGQGLVLRRDSLGEFDERITLFTEEWGKVKAKTISSRKPLSKLSPHLEIGNVIRMRCVEKHDLQLVDALKVRATEYSLFDLYALDRLLFEDEIDGELWDDLSGETLSWELILSRLGWDSRYAICAECNQKNVVMFDLRTHTYLCGRCSGYVKREDRLLLKEVNL